MLSKNNKRKTDQVQIILLEQLIPKNHIFRKIDKYIDFDFIYELVEDKYSLDNGRPSIDPVVLIKILFIEYLFNIKSMRQTIKEIEQECLYETEGYRYTKKGKEEYKRRKETVERQFGSAKEFHGFRYTNMIGLAKMEMKAALTFVYINMKKLAILLYKLDPNKDLMLNKLRIFLMNILKMQQTQEIFLGLSTIWQVLFYTCFFIYKILFSNLKS